MRCASIRALSVLAPVLACTGTALAQDVVPIDAPALHGTWLSPDADAIEGACVVTSMDELNDCEAP